MGDLKFLTVALASRLTPSSYCCLFKAVRCVIGRRDVKRVGSATGHRKGADPGNQSYELLSAKDCFGGCIGGVAQSFVGEQFVGDPLRKQFAFVIGR